MQPAGRLATVSDSAPLVVYFAGDASCFVTGKFSLAIGNAMASTS